MTDTLPVRGGGLARRLAAWSAALTAGTLALGLVAGIAAALWSSQRQAEADARAVAARLSAALAEKLADIDAALGTLGRSTLVANGLSDSSALEDTVAPLLREHSVSQRFGAEMAVCDAFGRWVVGRAPARPSAAGASPSPDDHAHCMAGTLYDAALARGERVAGVHDTRNGAALVWIVPVRLPATGTHEGAVVASIPLGALLQSVAGSDVTFISLRTAGEALATYAPSGQRERLDHVVAAPVDLRSTPSLQGLDLDVRVGYESAEVAVPWVRILGGYAAGALLLAVLTTAAAFAMARRLVAPFEAIGRLATSPQGGVPAAWTPFARRSDEAGMLAQRLGELTHRLELQRAEIDRALQAAQAASVAKTEFLAVMSHELRTPLNAVTGLAALAASDPEPQRRAHLAQLQRSAQHLRRLVDGILDFSSLESGRIELSPVPCRLTAVVGVVCDATQPAAMAKALPLRVEIAPDVPPVVMADPLRLEQVLVNLVANAVKFTERGEVTLRIARHGDELHFEVTDTGIGIAAKDLPVIFEAFRQADASTARRYGGSGLGLAICRRFVTLMGGRIEVCSTLGKGSRFVVAVPLQVAPEPPPSPAADRAAELRERLAGRVVLVAEDDEVNRLLTGALLARLDIPVIEARSGDEALQVLRAPPRPVGLVLMDCHMPGIDGFEATRRLRADPRLQDLPVIACTADVVTKDRDTCREAGMDDYVSKPIDRETLIATMLRCLAERQGAAPEAARTVPGRGAPPGPLSLRDPAAAAAD